MSGTVATGGREQARAARWVATARDTSLRAWRSLTWRHWVAAATVGLLCSLGQSLLYASRDWLRGDTLPQSQLDLFLRYVTRWTPLLMICACLLLFGFAMLEQHERGAAPQLRRYALLVLVIGALSLLIIDPALILISEAINAAFSLSSPWDGFTSSWPVPLVVALVCLPTLLIMLSLWTLIYLYLRSARRTAQALATAQARRAEAERRVLAEQLAGAQAMVEPEFLFDTLKLTEELFERDAAKAQRLLDELIIYLRGALPGDDGGTTLRQQIELVRARLEIERIRLNGRLSVLVDVPEVLADQPFAPLLLAPLAANAIRHGIEPAGGGELAVRARRVEDGLVIEVTDSGTGAVPHREDAGLAALRERLTALYGEGARLVVAHREPSGTSARLELPDGGGS